MNKNAPKDLCRDLQRLLQHELDTGNSILAVERGWSKVSLAVRLSGPLDMAYVKIKVAHNPDLEIWESHDPKNPQEAGVLCKSARQTLSGKLPE